MAIKLKIVTDNYVRQSQAISEHGFSLLIEEGNHRILFDTGASVSTLSNNLNLFHIDKESIESVVISHGHSDHCGGLPFFSDTSCPIFIGDNYNIYRTGSRNTYIGLDEQSSEIVSIRGRIVKEIHRLTTNVWIIPAYDIQIDKHSHVEGFKKRNEEGVTVDDKIDDELFIAVISNGFVNVVSGCAHRGIIGMTKKAMDLTNLPLGTVIGGLHTINDGDEKIIGLSKLLTELSPLRIICGHCTGLKPYSLLSIQLPNIEVTHTEVGLNIFV